MSRAPLTFPLVLGLLSGLHLAHARVGEPFFNNDESRHVMTGVFFRDVYVDGPVWTLRDYTSGYYLQYPALGLLIWPPLFHALEGFVMLICGDQLLTAKLLIGAFAALACWYLFLFVRRTHTLATAALTVLLFGLSPMVFQFSEHVMLEIPMLAFVLAALYHINLYLDNSRWRDLAPGCAFTAAAALTRFDGIVLAPCFALLIACKGRWDVLGRRAVWLGAALAVLATLPYYALAGMEIASVHTRTVQQGQGDAPGHFLGSRNFLFYPSVVPEQVGVFLVAPAVLGLALALRRSQRTATAPYLALTGATYLTFTPLAELEPRHAFPWIPALSLFAADGLLAIGRFVHNRATRWFARPGPQKRVPGTPMPLATLVLAGVAVTGTGWLACHVPAVYVIGYEEAAAYVVDNNRATPVCLFDSYLNGNFIYQVRRHDPDRRLWVLRGDKIFYTTLVDTLTEYRELAPSEEAILALIFKYDPEYLVLEELHPPAEVENRFNVPMTNVLRQVIRAHPERFTLAKTIELESNHVAFRHGRLHVYHNLLRNPNPASQLDIDMIGLGRSIRTSIPRPGTP